MQNDKHLNKIKYSLTADVRSTLKEIRNALRASQSGDSISLFNNREGEIGGLMRELNDHWVEVQAQYNTGTLQESEYTILMNLFDTFYKSQEYRTYKMIANKIDKKNYSNAS